MVNYGIAVRVGGEGKQSVLEGGSRLDESGKRFWQVQFRSRGCRRVLAMVRTLSSTHQRMPLSFNAAEVDIGREGVVSRLVVGLEDVAVRRGKGGSGVGGVVAGVAVGEQCAACRDVVGQNHGRLRFGPWPGCSRRSRCRKRNDYPCRRRPCP